MNLSDLHKIEPLRNQLLKINRMKMALESFPGYEAYLNINGDGLKFDRPVAGDILDASAGKIIGELMELGVTVDPATYD